MTPTLNRLLAADPLEFGTLVVRDLVEHGLIRLSSDSTQILTYFDRWHVGPALSALLRHLDHGHEYRRGEDVYSTRRQPIGRTQPRCRGCDEFASLAGPEYLAQLRAECATLVLIVQGYTHRDAEEEIASLIAVEGVLAS